MSTMAMAAVASVLVAAAPLDRLSGTWQLWRVASSGEVQVRMTLDASQNRGWNNSETYAPAALGLTDADIDGPTSSKEFLMRREAGSFHFTGSLGASKGSGAFEFSSNEAFVRGMEQRKLTLESNRDVMTAANVDLTLAYVDAIRGFYPDLSFEKLVAFRALRVTTDSISQMRTSFGDASASDMLSLTAMRVTKEYIDELARAGYPHLAAHQVIAFKALGIDETYIRHLTSHGMKNLTPDQVIEMKAMRL